ncbi:MAG: TetR family transcriptional regulator [Rhodococcus sp. (in: high G+C Gram-positive bacteria)]|jgi:AcrR family transcriptional regulator|uniref:TetR/AcrR family transcriptional regulator n=1 Tax=Rhodococcus sp. EPR-157 TaxID=1813677 RepID=UPI0007BAE2FE|nr:TetR/AcrR family transcriptional regulator [Rhodococcus sp. EPR-157]KZF09410.1 TetR family transcriptional regulator [Rhodococcus sp. EPR-157]
MARKNERRSEALSHERIVDAAIEILDAVGENALTFRALSARLSTGSGAIYWHVRNKGELLDAATDGVVTRVLADKAVEASPRESITATALALFDTIDARPWVGAQLARETGHSATAKILEVVGAQVHALGVPESALFDATTALVNYILGVAVQNAANARLHGNETDRTTVLTAIAHRWTELDPARFPFLHRIAAQMPEHDDRMQFLAGIDYFLAGIESRVPHRK